MWSHERIKRPRKHQKFNSKQVRAEARQAAREYALQTKGAEHREKVDNLLRTRESRRQKKDWLARVERGLRLQDREITARRWLLRRGAMTGSDFSPAERSELRRWFDVLDTDGGGDIDLAELAAPLLSTGIASSITQVRAIIQKNEIEEGGGIDFESFQRLLKRGTQTGQPGEARDREDVGLVALQKLRTHVEAAQSNLGLNLDSRINATRRKILLNALKEIRYGNVDSDNGSKVVSRVPPRQQKAKASSDDVLEEKRLQKLQKRRESAAKAQRKEDKMLALWRVVLGSKASHTAGFHLGQLPPVTVDRGKVYSEWAEKVPRMHADSDVVRYDWQQVDHWMARSRNLNDKPPPVLSERSENSAEHYLRQSQSAPELQSKGKKPKTAEKVTQLERMLSSYLRPTRADIARSRKLKERKRQGRKVALDPPKQINIGSNGKLHWKSRSHPPMSIVIDHGEIVEKKIDIQVPKVARKNINRRRGKNGILVTTRS
jgi:Ca2+-binding EF-hand superfamily protein